MREKIENFPEELFFIENDNKNYSQLFEKMISGNIFLPDIPDFWKEFIKKAKLLNQFGHCQKEIQPFTAKCVFKSGKRSFLQFFTEFFQLVIMLLRSVWIGELQVLDRFQDNGRDDKACIVFVIGGDDVPGTFFRRGG